MDKTTILALLLAPAVQADVTWVQETYPGTTIGNPSRGYVTIPEGGGYTRVIPSRSGIQDNDRPGYLVGPGLGTDLDTRLELNDDSPRTQSKSVLDLE